jgi:hypothetical protein
MENIELELVQNNFLFLDGEKDEEGTKEIEINPEDFENRDNMDDFEELTPEEIAKADEEYSHKN